MSPHIRPPLLSGRSDAGWEPSTASTARLRTMKEPLWAVRTSCATLLLFTLPVMVLAGIAVLATSPGPLLTWSASIGPDRRVVVLRRFRTTYGHGGGHGAVPDRPRGFTPVGWFLRQSGIARLPRLVDVWSGKIGLAAALRS